MQRRQSLKCICAGAFATLGTPLRSLASIDAQTVLAESDAVRNPARPFRAMVRLVEFEKGQQVNSSSMATFSRPLENRGQFGSLIQFLEPARDTGKLMLKTGTDLWFYDPSTKASVRISPQQRLMGQAANGDVVTVNFAHDYQASLAGEESAQDGERRKRNAYKLALTASNEDATYPAIELWVDVETKWPIKARFLSDSGRLLKTAFYRKFQNQLGAERPTETVIIDGVNTQAVTLVRMTDFQARNLPVSWFQRDYLPRFQGE